MTVEWKLFPDTAPRDRQILVSGTYRPFDILPGGDEAVVISAWSSIIRDGVSGYHWIGLGSYNVDWTHWTELPRRTPAKS